MIDYKMLLEQTKNLSILLVEDYKPLRDDMAEVLENFFKKVIVAEDGKEAWILYNEYESAYQRSFDIVMTDIQMPHMDGVELCEHIRAHHPKQVVIVLSAHTETEYLLKLINLGISKFLTKPIKDSALLETLYVEAKQINTEEKENVNTPLVDLGEGVFWNKKKCILRDAEKEIALTRHEVYLLQLLWERKDAVCTTSDILLYFQDNNIELSEKNIRNLIFKLRRKIPEKRIASMYGLGYKFTLEC